MDDSLKYFLRLHEIEYILHTHKSVYTVEEAQIHCGHIPGMHCKNLFMRDSKKKIFYLVTLPAKKQFEIKTLKQKFKSKKLSFAKPEQLRDKLGLEPGSVSPLGLMNNETNDIIYYVDQEVWDAKKVCFHPNINTETLELTNAAFHKIIKVFNNVYFVLKL